MQPLTCLQRSIIAHKNIFAYPYINVILSFWIIWKNLITFKIWNSSQNPLLFWIILLNFLLAVIHGLHIFVLLYICDFQTLWHNCPYFHWYKHPACQGVYWIFYLNSSPTIENIKLILFHKLFFKLNWFVLMTYVKFLNTMKKNFILFLNFSSKLL